MFSKEFMGLFFQIIKTWQVLAITVALVAYMFLVNYVSRTYHRPRFASKLKPRKSKAEAKAKAAAEDENSNEALGLEEA